MAGDDSEKIEMNKDAKSKQTSKRRKGSKAVYPCDQWEYKGPKNALSRHKISDHQLISFPCDMCEFGANSSKNLKLHKKLYHEGIKHPCDQCDYAATQSSHLKEHKDSVHLKIKYQCDKCDYTAKCVSLLRHHKEFKHEGICINSCNECDYKAFSHNQLKRHKESNIRVSDIPVINVNMQRVSRII